jgi:hypothetical protein
MLGVAGYDLRSYKLLLVSARSVQEIEYLRTWSSFALLTETHCLLHSGMTRLLGLVLLAT